MNLISGILASPFRALRTPANRPKSFVPRLESLEARALFANLLVTGLDGAFGSTVGPDGNLYVTEQIAGRISRVNPHTGQVTTFASGLPSDSPYAGLGGGVMDLAFIDNIAYVLTAAVGPSYEGGNARDVVGIYRIDSPTSSTVIANLGAWSAANPPPPDFEIFDPNGAQYAMQPYRGGFLVTDGHHNRVVHVTLDGQITQLLQFGNVVPTGLEVRGNTVYLSQAGPVPHKPETGKLLSFTPGSTAAPKLVASGAPLLVDVELGPGNTLFALSQGYFSGGAGMEGYPADPDTGSLVRVNADGTFNIVDTGLDRPTSLEFIGNTAYVTGLGGQIVTIDVSRRPTDVVLGGGRAVLTDPNGKSFGATFALAAVRRANGSADGFVDFTFGPAFGQQWSTVSGVDRIQLQGKITSFTVAADGTIVLEGRLTQKEFKRGRLVFAERDVPFRIVIGPNSTGVSLTWNDLPTFELEVSRGGLRNLRIR